MSPAAASRTAGFPLWSLRFWSARVVSTHRYYPTTVLRTARARVAPGHARDDRRLLRGDRGDAEEGGRRPPAAPRALHARRKPRRLGSWRARELQRTRPDGPQRGCRCGPGGARGCGYARRAPTGRLALQGLG